MENLIRHDWCNGIKSKRILFIGLIIVTLINCIMVSLRINDVLDCNAGLIDYLYGIYGGERSLTAITISEIIKLPVCWMFIMLFIIIAIIEYPLRDLREYGRYNIIRCRNISDWWIAKIVWCIIYNLITHAVIIITCVIVSIINSAYTGEISSGINSIFHREFFEKRDEIVFRDDINDKIIYYVVMSIVITLMLSLFFMALSYIIGQMQTVAGSVVCICLSVFYSNEYLPFNQTMVARTGQIDGINIWSGAAISLILMLIANIAAINLIKKRDIL